MREERLLERIQTWEEEPAKRGKEDPGRITHSVVRHLQRILNTRQGNALIADDYGIPDFMDFLQAYPDSVRDIERAIKVTIQKYERRLQGVRVSFVPHDDDFLSLRFSIRAKLTSESKIEVNFETVIDHEGKITVKG